MWETSQRSSRCWYEAARRKTHVFTWGHRGNIRSVRRFRFLRWLFLTVEQESVLVGLNYNILLLIDWNNLFEIIPTTSPTLTQLTYQLTGLRCFLLDSKKRNTEAIRGPFSAFLQVTAAIVWCSIVSEISSSLISCIKAPFVALGLLRQKREMTGMRQSCAPSCRCRDKSRWLCASLSCHGTLNTISSLSCPNTEGQFEEPQGGIRPKKCRPDLDTHRWVGPWRIKGQQMRGKK